MKYLTEYRDGAAAEKLAAAIARTVTRPWTIMEVCGGQTHTIVKYGLDTILPPGVELVHGPGCPVCVTSLEMIDRAHAIAARPDVIFCSFGDMLRVPGSRGDLLAAEVARERRPDRLFAARRRQSRGRQSRPAGRLLRDRLRDDRARQRHGRRAGPPAAAGEFQRAGVARAGAAGDEGPARSARQPRARVPGPGPCLRGHGLWRVRADRPRLSRADRDHRASSRSTCSKASCGRVRQLEAGRAELENPYARAVRPEGNPASRRLIDDVFEVCDRKWRGIGLIPQSGYKLRDEYRDHDAERLFEVDGIETHESSVCISGQILKGLKKPHDCPAFGRECTPQTPLGATMVSSEGACAAYYAYGRHLEAGSASGSLANPISQPSLPQVPVGGGH